jgi:purine-nucleoside/S-methyl-5'-thioadenosine phosphorylase / adenosine deaminase
MTPHRDPIAYLTFSGLEALGVPHATTTRHCPGVTSPAEPSAPFRPEAATILREAGIDAARVAYVRQVHGADVVVARSGGGYSGDADGLVTTERGAALAVFTADCLAITLYDPVAPALAVVHAGWRGTARGAAQAALAALVDRGGRRERVHAAIAPAIGACCYEVDVPVIDALAHAYGPAARRWMTPAREGHVMLDLVAANEDILREAGVARIETSGVCTACRQDLLYSYRAGQRGRLVTVVALP